MTAVVEQRLNTIRKVVAEVLEIAPSVLTETSRFVEDHNADSLRAIEILSRLEMEFDIEIPQNDLARMTNLVAVYAVMKECAGWPD